jgi:hypothetical protein
MLVKWDMSVSKVVNVQWGVPNFVDLKTAFDQGFKKFLNLIGVAIVGHVVNVKDEQMKDLSA